LFKQETFRLIHWTERERREKRREKRREERREEREESTDEIFFSFLSPSLSPSRPPSLYLVLVMSEAEIELDELPGRADRSALLPLSLSSLRIHLITLNLFFFFFFVPSRGLDSPQDDVAISIDSAGPIVSSSTEARHAKKPEDKAKGEEVSSVEHRDSAYKRRTSQREAQYTVTATAVSGDSPWKTFEQLYQGEKQVRSPLVSPLPSL
jgi:hypothetical protein